MCPLSIDQGREPPRAALQAPGRGSKHRVDRNRTRPDVIPRTADEGRHILPEAHRSVVVNLIDNAAEALENSPFREILISTCAHPDAETVEICVSDTGQGISPQDKDKLFLPHFSTKNRGTAPSVTFPTTSYTGIRRKLIAMRLSTISRGAWVELLFTCT